MSEIVVDDKEFLENNSDKYKPLAWIETIVDIQPIENADRLEMGRVSCGNEVILEKGVHQVGDEVIYVSVDNMLPPDNRWAFLERDKWKVKCKKMRGSWSDGLVLPKIYVNLKYDPGTDVTSDLGVTKIPEKIVQEKGGGAIFGRAKGKFPEHSPKTDEENLYSLKPQRLLETHRGRVFWRSVKMHGSSCSMFFIRNESLEEGGYFGVCSRNLEVQDDDKSEFWKIARKYDIKQKLSNFVLSDPEGFNLTVQGEAVGPKLNGNIYKFPEIRFYVHNIWNIDRKRHLTPKEMIALCDKLGLPYCPGEIYVLTEPMEKLIEHAEQPSIFNPDAPEEGEVYRLYEDTNDYCDIVKGRLSFKIVSRIFKEKAK